MFVFSSIGQLVESSDWTRLLHSWVYIFFVNFLGITCIATEYCSMRSLLLLEYLMWYLNYCINCIPYKKQHTCTLVYVHVSVSWKKYKNFFQWSTRYFNYRNSVMELCNHIIKPSTHFGENENILQYLYQQYLLYVSQWEKF